MLAVCTELLIKLILGSALKLCSDTNHIATEALKKLSYGSSVRVYYAPATEDGSSAVTIFGRSDSNADSVT